MRRLVLPCIFSLATGVSIFACTPGSLEESASSADNLTTEELALARTARGYIAASNARCTSCHTASREDITRWGTAMKAVEAACLSPSLSLTPLQRVECLRETPSDPESGATATKL